MRYVILTSNPKNLLSQFNLIAPNNGGVYKYMSSADNFISKKKKWIDKILLKSRPPGSGLLIFKLEFAVVWKIEPLIKLRDDF